MGNRVPLVVTRILEFSKTAPPALSRGCYIIGNTQSKVIIPLLPDKQRGEKRREEKRENPTAAPSSSPEGKKKSRSEQGTGGEEEEKR